jgi:small subunit ribosomal protein S18
MARQCYFCGQREINWKDVETLRRFLSLSMKIKSREKTGLCAKHQGQLAKAVKRARQTALLPFTPE